MRAYNSVQVIAGLSAEKWSLRQLRLLQPGMQRAFADYRAHVLAAPTSKGEGKGEAEGGPDLWGGLQSAVTECVCVFFPGEASLSGATSASAPSAGLVGALGAAGNAEVLSDLLKLLVAFHCCADQQQQQQWLASRTGALWQALLGSFTEALPPQAQDREVEAEGGAGNGGVAERVEEGAGGAGGSRLNALSALGNLGFEDGLEVLLVRLNAAATPATYTTPSTATEEKSSKPKAKAAIAKLSEAMVGPDSLQSPLSTALAQFAVQYLTLARSVVRFHANRKKMFLRFCAQLAVQALTLLSHCSRNSSSDSSFSHSDSTSNSHSHSWWGVGRALGGVVEGALFDDRAVEEFASMRLACISPAPISASASASASGAAGAGKGKAKRARGSKGRTDADADADTGADADTSVGAGEGGARARSYYDALLQALRTSYYAAHQKDWRHFAQGVAHLMHIYGNKSEELAAAARPGNAYDSGAAGVGGGQGGGMGGVNGQGLEMDAAGTRKHLCRVFHFALLLVEALGEGGEGGGEAVLQALHLLQVQAQAHIQAEAEAEGAGGDSKKASKKRKHSLGGASQCGTVENASASTSGSVLGAVQYCVARNAVLCALASVLGQQSVPQHETTARYLAALAAYGGQSVRAAEVLQGVRGASASPVSPMSTSASALTPPPTVSVWVRRLQALELLCLHCLAGIHYALAVDDCLPPLVSVLAGTAEEAEEGVVGEVEVGVVGVVGVGEVGVVGVGVGVAGTAIGSDSDSGEWAGWSLLEARRALLLRVLTLHGQLRLLPQLVAALLGGERRLLLQRAALATAMNTLSNTSNSVGRLGMLEQLVGAPDTVRLLVALFSAAPVGQTPLLWDTLAEGAKERREREEGERKKREREVKEKERRERERQERKEGRGRKDADSEAMEVEGTDAGADVGANADTGADAEAPVVDVTDV
ncbi:hypothetical protein B484DRAFT_454805, partial [Ochromonadaceae sp. CCMP2298]